MPLLIRLGTLINDIQFAEIHQPVRDPKTWNLNDDAKERQYKVIEPSETFPIVALNISLSATINTDRITSVLGSDCSIYTVTIDSPFNDFLKSKKQLQDFVYVNHRTDVAIVATVKEAFGDDIIGIGRYYLDEKTNYAEVAFMVHDLWQNRGIGTFLLKHLMNIAKRNGISGFMAEVIRDNKPMQRVLNKSETKITCTPHQNVMSYRLKF